MRASSFLDFLLFWRQGLTAGRATTPFGLELKDPASQHGLTNGK